MPVPVFISTISGWDFPFYYPLISTCYFFVFDITSHLLEWLLSHCGFDLYFPHVSDAEHLFMYLLSQFYIFFGTMSIQILCSFKKNFFFWLLNFMSYCYILNINPLSDNMIAWHFIAFHRCWSRERPRGATPCPKSGVAKGRKYPTSKVRSSREETPRPR